MSTVGHVFPSPSTVGNGTVFVVPKTMELDITGLQNDALSSHYVIAASGQTSNCAVATLTSHVKVVKLECVVVPSGAADDLDFLISDSAAGSEGAATPGSTTVAMDIGASFGLGMTIWSAHDDLGGSKSHLYLTHGAGSSGTYTAGKFILTIYETL